jgi:hypothetical protein
MGFEHPRKWKRELIDGYIYWTAKFEMHCYNCGKLEHGTAVVREGKYDPELIHTIKDEKTGNERKIYPTFAPQDNKIHEWRIPNGWSQITHITSEFYPMEIITAIKNAGWDAADAFEKWYNDVGTQYAEWICPSEDCFVEGARKIYQDFKMKYQMEQRGEPVLS